MNKDVIGARTTIEFVHDSTGFVPAKVDTGADFSSVWASEIKEHDGVLSFTLFAKGSKYYTGTIHRATMYRITQVKNSFGHVENRYKTTLSVRIAGRRIRAEFNLADRSRNRYPILIGKKTLSGKFLVDTKMVASAAQKEHKNVLILNSIDSDIVAKFASDLSSATPGLTCHYSTYDDLLIYLDNGTASIIRNSTGEKLEEYDLVYFKTHFQRQEFAASLSELFDAWGIQYIDKEIGHHPSNTKVTQYLRLSQLGLPVPKTIMINTSILADQFDRFVNFLGLPFILKDPEADKGLRNYLVKTEQQFNTIVKETELSQKYYVAQEFIPNEGDLRLVVLDKEVKLIIGRRASQGSETHLNNTSTGGSAELIPVLSYDSAVKVIAVQAALALDRQVAGVDLIQNTDTGKWYILEVNNSPQLASGAFMNEKIKVFGTFLRQYADK